MDRGLTMRWSPVVDERGSTRLEARWAPASGSQSAPAQAAAHTARSTHAA